MSFEFNFNTTDRTNDSINDDDISSAPTASIVANDAPQLEDISPCRVLDVSINTISTILYRSSHTDISLPHNSSLQSLQKINIEKNQSNNQKLVHALNNDKNKYDLFEKINNQHEKDIISGEYEGGLKVWECSMDLVNYLAEEIARNDHLSSKGHKLCSSDVISALRPNGSTLELGCGHGLPACLILREMIRRKGHQKSVLESREITGQQKDNKDPIVVFSDYNDFVLQDVTIPNVVMNLSILEWGENPNLKIESCLKSCVRFVGGDWMDLSNKLSNEGRKLKCFQKQVSNIDDHSVDTGRFDLVLAAETTYTVSSAKHTILLLLRHLKLDSGIGLIATKRYYFGVGGGIDVLHDEASRAKIIINGLVYGLMIENIKEYDSGQSNIRDLLRVKCVQK